MSHLVDFGKFIIVNFHVIVQGLLGFFTAMTAVCTALASIALLIPGEQPEKAVKAIGDFFHACAEFLAKISRKPEGYAIDNVVTQPVTPAPGTVVAPDSGGTPPASK